MWDQKHDGKPCLQRSWHGMQKVTTDWAAVLIWSDPHRNFTNHFVEVYPNGVRARQHAKEPVFTSFLSNSKEAQDLVIDVLKIYVAQKAIK